MSLVIKRNTTKNITYSDQLMIPITQNFWGYILPFQGSLIYSAAIFKRKYDINISKTIYIYIFITFFSIWIGGIIAFIHSIFIERYFYGLFFLQIILLPLFFKIFQKFLVLIPKKFKLVKIIRFHLTHLIRSVNHSIRDKYLLINLAIYDFLFVLVYALWTYYLSEYFKLHIEFTVWFLWSYFLKITLLAKITPGNIGVVQAYTAGFLLLYGHSAEDGVMISMIQLALLVILIFPIAFINSMFNLKYFDFNSLRKRNNE
jgi:hypothetical protein